MARQGAATWSGPWTGSSADRAAPAKAGAARSADDPVHGHEHVAALCRAIGEGSTPGQMPPADLDAWMVGGDQSERDANIGALPQMIVRIEQAEGEAKQRRFRRERDVALVPG